MAFSTSAVSRSGHVPMSLPVAGSSNYICVSLFFNVNCSVESLLTVDLEGLARLSSNPLAIDVGLLNEEGWIFQLISGLASRSQTLYHQVLTSGLLCPMV